MLIDMNSYFASVEQQANRLLRGKPVGVCPYLSPNGIILASSIEAKAQGVKTAMTVRDAQRLCPGIILVQSDPAKYRYLTDQIFSILADISDTIEPYSIDEAFVELTGFASSFEDAARICQNIQHRVKNEVGEWLKMKIGISTTRYLAKLVADHLPPDGIQTLAAPDVPAYLRTLGLTDLWGINTRMAARLHLLGIGTPLELRAAPVENLMTVLGKMGYMLWANVNGIELGGLRRDEPAKSISHQYSLRDRTDDPQQLRSVILKLCERVGRGLRAGGREAQSSFIGWWYLDGDGDGGSMRHPTPIWDGGDLYRVALEVFTERFARRRVRLLVTGVSDLVPRSPQLAFWEGDARARRLTDALDGINNTYGEFTIQRGTMMPAQADAPDRIGFRKTMAARWVDRSGISLAKNNGE